MRDTLKDVLRPSQHQTSCNMHELNVECKVSCCSSNKCNGAPERAPTESPGEAPRRLPGGPYGESQWYAHWEQQDEFWEESLVLWSTGFY